jgi:hypothetical protein
VTEQLKLQRRYGNAGDVGAPYQPGSSTSREAAQAIADHASEQRTEVYLCIRKAKHGGRTWDECVAILGCSPTANGRVTELVDLALICDAGVKRKTRRGRNAVVWIATEFRS